MLETLNLKNVHNSSLIKILIINVPKKIIGWIDIMFRMKKVNGQRLKLNCVVIYQKDCHYPNYLFVISWYEILQIVFLNKPKICFTTFPLQHQQYTHTHTYIIQMRILLPCYFLKTSSNCHTLTAEFTRSSYSFMKIMFI